MSTPERVKLLAPNVDRIIRVEDVHGWGPGTFGFDPVDDLSVALADNGHARLSGSVEPIIDLDLGCGDFVADHFLSLVRGCWYNRTRCQAVCLPDSG